MAPAAHVHVPYRSSLLTRILAESLLRRDAALAVIGTVSPTPTDTEHTVSTLRAISVLGGSSGVPKEEKEDVPAVRRMWHAQPPLWQLCVFCGQRARCRWRWSAPVLAARPAL